MGVTDKNLEHSATLLFKSAMISLLTLSPSLMAGLYLLDNRVPLHSPYATGCIVLLLAAADFMGLLFLEPYRRHLSRLTLPALVGAMTVVFLFVLVDALNRFIENLGFSFLAPFAAAGLILLYAALFAEKNIALKVFLCLNSIAVMLLWAMGSIDKVSMPF